MTKPKPLCGRCDDGWVVDPETFLPVRRCPCRLDTASSPERERDTAIAATVDANPNAMKAALRIIHDAAIASPVVSPNSVRYEMDLAGIPGPVRGGAWRQACDTRHRYVRPAGTEPSTQTETHAHHIRIYESLIFGRSKSTVRVG